MSNIKSVFLGMMRRLKVALVVSLLVGLFGIVLYYLGRPIAQLYNADDKIDVALIDNDKSVLSEQLKIYLSEKVNMNIEENEPEKFQEKLINRDISAIIEIPSGLHNDMLSGKSVIINTTTLDDYENGAYVSVYIDSFMRSADTAAKAACGDSDTFSDILTSTAYETKLSTLNAVVSDREEDFVSAGFSFAEGFMMMLVTAIGIFITIAVMDDRQYGTYSRMCISSVTGLQYISGTLAASSLISLLTLLPLPIYLICTGAKIDLHPVMLFVIIIVYSLFNSALAVLLAQLINTKQALATLSGCITSIGALLGGAWFPIDQSVGFLKYLSYITPQYWYVNFVSGESEQPIINLLVLVLYTILIMLSSAVLFSRKSSVVKA